MTEAQFAKGGSRGQSKTNTVLVQWKSLRWGSVCQSPQFSLNGSDEWQNDWQSKCVGFFSFLKSLLIKWTFFISSYLEFSISGSSKVLL